MIYVVCVSLSHACAQLIDVLNYPRKGSFLNKQFLFSITSLLSPNMTCTCVGLRSI